MLTVPGQPRLDFPERGPGPGFQDQFVGLVIGDAAMTRQPEPPIGRHRTSQPRLRTPALDGQGVMIGNGLGDDVPRGSIKQLAIVQEVEKPVGIDPDLRAFGFQFPVVSCGATYAPKKIWGYATVETDGSIRVETIDDALRPLIRRLLPAGDE